MKTFHITSQGSKCVVSARLFALHSSPKRYAVGFTVPSSYFCIAVYSTWVSHSFACMVFWREIFGNVSTLEFVSSLIKLHLRLFLSVLRANSKWFFLLSFSFYGSASLAKLETNHLFKLDYPKNNHNSETFV